MSPHTILVVEHNLITLQMARAILERGGYTVLEAQNGQSARGLMAHECPDLVLLDLGLPDSEGFTLIAQLRALPGGAGPPILAFSDVLTEPEQTRLVVAGFTDYVAKPLEPSRLLDTIRAYLPLHGAEGEKPGSGQRVLVVNDDPLQRKLLTLQLEGAGFRVTTAQDGMDALERAGASPPEAIVSDVLMPHLDGFKLCQAIRQDAALARIPVVLVSAAYTEEADQQLARDVGADALVLHTPDLHNVIVTLLAGDSAPAARGPRPRQVSPTDDLAAEYTERVVRQLERQTSLNVDLTAHVAWLEAQCTILARLAETLKDPVAAEVALDELLHTCLGASGLARGAIYLLDAEEGVGNRPATREQTLRLRCRVGYSNGVAELLPAFFGHAEVLHRAMWEDELVELCASCKGVVQTSARTPPKQIAERILEQSGDTAILIVPLILGEECLGVLMVASPHGDLGERWGTFIRALGSQISQAIGLTRSLARLRASEEAQRQAREQAEQAVCLRDEFLSVAAHELKTPLTSLLGFTQVLLRRLDKVEQRAHIFDRFYQAHASSHRSGLGLGLYISRHIVEQHGGRLEAEFPPGDSSVFVVSLPTDLDGVRAQAGGTGGIPA